MSDQRLEDLLRTMLADAREEARSTILGWRDGGPVIPQSAEHLDGMCLFARLRQHRDVIGVLGGAVSDDFGERILRDIDHARQRMPVTLEAAVTGQGGTTLIPLLRQSCELAEAERAALCLTADHLDASERIDAVLGATSIPSPDTDELRLLGDLDAAIDTHEAAILRLALIRDEQLRR
jgi:hypothetical protein